MTDRANKIKRLIEALETAKIASAQVVLRAEEYEKVLEEDLKHESEKNKEALS